MLSTTFSSNFNDKIGVFGEGLGGFVTFYLALVHGRMKSIALQNSPAILTEEKFQDAVLGGEGDAKRSRRYLHLLKMLVKIIPKMKLPISFYLDWMKVG